MNTMILGEGWKIKHVSSTAGTLIWRYHACPFCDSIEENPRLEKDELGELGEQTIACTKCGREYSWMEIRVLYP